MTRRPFEPVPFSPGAPIEWTHYHSDGRSTVRTGTVWDRAPELPGARIVAWVVPDQPLPSDLYAAVAVAKASARFVPVNGPWLDGPAARKCEAFSSDYIGSPTGGLAHGAARSAHNVQFAA